MIKFWQNNNTIQEDNGELENISTKLQQNLAELECEEAIINDKKGYGRVRTNMMKVLRAKNGNDVANRALSRVNKRLQENYFHAVFEATKSVADKIRSKSGCKTDGHRLVDDAFGGKLPILAFNTLQTPTDQSEHTGIMSLLKGLFSTFRNVTAHEPKIKWSISENDALDIMTLASMLHRRLDSAVPTDPGTISP